VLVEGFKGGDFPRLEVWRAEVRKATLWPAWPGIVAIASEDSLPSAAAKRIDLADTAAIAAFVRSNATER
jgi:molybdopterin-guanine dinucleotide biosynthesis protein B